METVNVTDNATFARVKLGDIRPNRFRNLERWPLEQEVLDKLKQSIGETGFWSNLQAIENERGEIELRFGHHRLAAGLELFGPEYEVAIEIVPYRGEWNLQKALKFENAIGRNKVAHSNEVVYQTMHWWDDGVFEEFPTWYDCINNVEQAQYLLSLSELEHYFGKQNENGPGHYAQCVKYGIGETVLSKMLGDAVSLTEIRESLTSQEVTARRKRGMELKAAEERAKPSIVSNGGGCTIVQFGSKSESLAKPSIVSNRIKYASRCVFGLNPLPSRPSLQTPRCQKRSGFNSLQGGLPEKRAGGDTGKGCADGLSHRSETKLR